MRGRFQRRILITKIEKEDLFLEICNIPFHKTNLGAQTESDPGLFFLWGDSLGYSLDLLGTSSGQKSFLWSDYKWTDDNGTTMSKYNSANSVLDKNDDAATKLYHYKSRMPAYLDFEWLNSHSTKLWVSNYNNSGVSGMLYTDKETYLLMFLPSGSIINGAYQSTTGNYWINETSSSDVTMGRLLILNNNSSCTLSDDYRYNGFHIRPRSYIDYDYYTSVSSTNLNSSTISRSCSVKLGAMRIAGTSSTLVTNYLKSNYGTYTTGSRSISFYIQNYLLYKRYYMKYILMMQILSLASGKARFLAKVYGSSSKSRVKVWIYLIRATDNLVVRYVALNTAFTI